MLVSSDVATAGTGCQKIRRALLDMFTEEESSVILAKLIDGFGAVAIAAMKEPCLNATERLALKKMGVTDPISAAPAAPQTASSDPRDPARDNQTQLRWSAIKDFLGQFGRVLAAQASQARVAAREAQKVALYFDDRVATQSFDVSDLLPSSDGVLRETLAAKLVSWPFGTAVRFGCFMSPSKMLAPKYSAQFLLELGSGSASPILLDVIAGFSDPNVTNVSDLKIGNLLLERATAGSLQSSKETYKDGCGDRSDPWKPWDANQPARQAGATSGSRDFAAGSPPDRLTFH
jgi:hypothetical protein